MLGMEATGARNPTGTLIVIAVLAVLGADVSPAHSADPSRACPPARPVHPHVRAGCPQSIAWWAQPSNTAHYRGYYEGGSTQFHGETRCPHEGVWGWDYLGALFEKHTWLGWRHGAEHHEGEPAYKTDGPKVISHE